MANLHRKPNSRRNAQHDGTRRSGDRSPRQTVPSNSAIKNAWASKYLQRKAQLARTFAAGWALPASEEQKKTK